MERNQTKIDPDPVSITFGVIGAIGTVVSVIELISKYIKAKRENIVSKSKAKLRLIEYIAKLSREIEMLQNWCNDILDLIDARNNLSPFLFGKLQLELDKETYDAYHRHVASINYSIRYINDYIRNIHDCLLDLMDSKFKEYVTEFEWLFTIPNEFLYHSEPYQTSMAFEKINRFIDDVKGVLHNLENELTMHNEGVQPDGPTARR